MINWRITKLALFYNFFNSNTERFSNSLNVIIYTKPEKYFETLTLRNLTLSWKLSFFPKMTAVLETHPPILHPRFFLFRSPQITRFDTLRNNSWRCRLSIFGCICTWVVLLESVRDSHFKLPQIFYFHIFSRIESTGSDLILLWISFLNYKEECLCQLLY